MQGIVDDAEDTFRKLGCSCGIAYLFRTNVSSSARCSRMLTKVVQKEFGAFPVVLFSVPCIGGVQLAECFRETIAHRCQIEFESNISHRESREQQRRHRLRQARDKAQWGGADAWQPIPPWESPKPSNVTLAVTFSVRYIFWKYQAAYMPCSTCGGPGIRSAPAPFGGPPAGGGGRAGSVRLGGNQDNAAFQVAAAESELGPIELLTPETEFWFNAFYNSQRAVPRILQDDHPH